MKYMFVIEKLISQITIQTSGQDHDPASVIANIDMRHFMDTLGNVEAMKDQESRYQKQLEKSRRLEKEMGSMQTGTNPENAKKIKELQDLLTEKISSADPSLFSRLSSALVFRS